MPEAIQAAFSGQLGTIFRHERNLVGLDILGDLHDRLGQTHLQVEFGGHRLPQDTDIAVVDVPTVLPQVRRNSVGPRQFTLDRRPDRIRFVGESRLTNGRYMVYVNVQNSHSKVLVRTAELYQRKE